MAAAEAVRRGESKRKRFMLLHDAVSVNQIMCHICSFPIIMVVVFFANLSDGRSLSLVFSTVVIKLL